MSEQPWLPADYVHPTRVPVGSGHHLRPIRADDVDLDMIAVMGSRERLWQTYGEAWGWPPATMTHEQDREDLQHHADEMDTHESFNYALFDADETALLGCVYIDPTTRPVLMPTSRGGSSTSVSALTWRRRWTSSCRSGSPRTGRWRGPATSVGT